MVFSHGLGGTRNSYSHLCGSLSSYGLIVVAPEHRDGSAPITFIREPVEVDGTNAPNPSRDRFATTTLKQAIDYQKIPHRPGKDVEDGRNRQLRIRLRELALLFEALRKIDQGHHLTNLDCTFASSSPAENGLGLNAFYGCLDVQRPGSIVWAGHSFGVATVIQFVKSVYYDPPSEPLPTSTLFTPDRSSSLVRQITPSSPLVLLDPWAMPLTGESTRWLFEKPLPTYTPAGPHGRNIIAILSEAFFKWDDNLKHTKRVLSADPRSASDSSNGGQKLRIFYAVRSAHLSQSDFGILFPWLTKKLCEAEEPERTLKLNVRAILQMLREQAYEVEAISRVDWEDPDVTQVTCEEGHSRHDWAILAPDGAVRGWVSITLDDGETIKQHVNVTGTAESPPFEAVVFEGEMPQGEPVPTKA